MYITANVIRISNINDETIRNLFKKKLLFKEEKSYVNRSVTIPSPYNHRN